MICLSVVVVQRAHVDKRRQRRIDRQHIDVALCVSKLVDAVEWRNVADVVDVNDGRAVVVDDDDDDGDDDDDDANDHQCRIDSVDGADNVVASRVSVVRFIIISPFFLFASSSYNRHARGSHVP